MIVSTTPPKIAAESPNSVPMSALIEAASKPTRRLRTSPCSVRVNISRPNQSVPSGCANEGGWLR
jgi:hypothetical protein